MNKRIKKKHKHDLKCKIKKLSPTKDDVIIVQLSRFDFSNKDIKRFHSMLHDILGDRKFIVFPDTIATVENIAVADRSYYAKSLRRIADYLDGGQNEDSNSEE